MDNKNIIDARGLSCPVPVVLTKKAIEKGPSSLQVIVDNVAAKENVSRYATAMGYTIKIEEKDNEETLLLLEKK